MDLLPSQEELSHTELDVRECKIYKRHILERLAAERPSSIILVSDPELSEEESDARSLMLQLQLNDIAEDFGVNTVQTAASVKNAIAKELEDKETLNPIQLGTAIFSKEPAMQEAFQQKMQDSGFTKDENVTVNKETLLKKVMNHKLKTDTGIELTIPAEYFDNTEFIEFNHAEDGSLYITLKHISSIINRG